MLRDPRHVSLNAIFSLLCLAAWPRRDSKISLSAGLCSAQTVGGLWAGHLLLQLPVRSLIFTEGPGPLYGDHGKSSMLTVL